MTEDHRPVPTGTGHGEPSDSSMTLKRKNSSKLYTRNPVATTAPASYPFSAVSIEIARWRSTPLTLIYIKDGKLCPRVEVAGADDGLYNILGLGQHPLETAIAKIQQYGYEKPISCEARSVLKIFFEINCTNYKSPSVTFLDPMLYATSVSQGQREGFQRTVWGWLLRGGTGYHVNAVLIEPWDLIMVEANYLRLEISLLLSKASSKITLSGPDYSEPPIAPRFVNLYPKLPHRSWSPMPQHLAPSVFKDIIFCHHWIREFNSEDICAAIKYRHRQPTLESYHIDDLSCNFFRGEYKDLISWVHALTQSEILSYRAEFIEARITEARITEVGYQDSTPIRDVSSLDRSL